MKREQNSLVKQLQWGVAVCGICAMIFIPQLLTNAYGMHTNYYYSVAALAEQELRTKEQNRLAEQRSKNGEVTASVSVEIDKERDHQNRPDKTDSKEK